MTKMQASFMSVVGQRSGLGGLSTVNAVLQVMCYFAFSAVFGVLPTNTTSGPMTVKVSGGGTDYSVARMAAEDGTWKVGKRV